ncbi:Subtilisin-like protein [Mycena sanguinolenta]|uniref:tripeptidyl-peptidase II n=1 Tax=Mycena sanguinolenta TaxID=230812 RepID=A0A8H6WRI6_9AGAR|nr:Subtilisin-like protein [Mycena sanguinolenta]
MLGVASFIALALALASAKPLADSLVVLERRDALPEGFVQTGAAPATQVLNLKINLVQNNLAGLESALYDAATPGSAKYGQWLSSDEVASFARPTDETTSAVTEWLTSNGIQSTSASAAGDWISISLDVAKANELLDADFSVFTHTDSGKQMIRTMQYSIPASLQSHINVFTPTTSQVFIFYWPKFVQTTVSPTPAAAAAGCSSTITPTCLQSMYQIPTTAATNKTNFIGVAGFDDQFANQADLTQFLKAERTDIPSTTAFKLISVDGGTNSQTLSQAGIEADLDIQYTVGVATGVTVDFVSVGEKTQDGADDGFLDIITALIAEAAPPQVLTTSYGFDTEASLSESLTVAMCNSYMQLTARGVSILFASGDGGVASTPGVQCTNKPFPPTFPTCPFATLVGATSGSAPETGASPLRWWFFQLLPSAVMAYVLHSSLQYSANLTTEADAVNAYIASIGTEYAGRYNTTGRAYPDVSASGENVLIVQGGRTGLVAGTSCASPIFASVIGLLNDELLNAGKPVLGFLNPWLYANPQAFNDITTGDNPGCGTQGFSASAGWDPVTGLGSPNFVAMRAAAGLS